jgi:membrane fusion protein, multidrug efflux system
MSIREGTFNHPAAQEFAMRLYLIPTCLVGLLLVVFNDGAPAGDDKPADVRVTLPVRRDVTDYVDFHGRTEAVTRVELRARVTGYLDKVAFKEGHEVRQGDVLFEIDPRPYKASLDQAQARMLMYEARLQRSKADRERLQRLIALKAAEPSELDKVIADEHETQAAIQEARAALEAARLNVSFTQVTAPCAGVIGLNMVTPGNLVKADDTVLAHIVSMDPQYVVFGIDEATLLRVRRLTNEGKLQSARDGKWPVAMALTGEKDFPHQGIIDFVSNEVSPTTSTIVVRGVFPNPKPANGVRLMTPGMFARVRLSLGGPHAALLVPERAVGVNHGEGYVYVLDDQNKAHQRRVVRGLAHGDDLREIIEGITAQDRIVVEWLSKPRLGVVLTPKMVSTP